jgi:RES domain-containing protein
MESRALCILERLVHLVRLPHDEAFTRIQIPDSVSSHTLLLDALPAGWSDPVEMATVQDLATGIMAERYVAVLIVPSIVVPSERCLVLNPQHPEFPRIRFDPPVLFKYDHRLIRER